MSKASVTCRRQVGRVIGINKPMTNLGPLNHIQELAIILLDLLLQVLAQEDLFDAADFPALFEHSLDSVQFTEVQ
jgi:hypothetical protein